MLEASRNRARDLLRRHGLRCAGPRVEVLTRLIEAHRPLSAHELIEVLEHDGINEATIYRTLNTLAGVGISRPVEMNGRKRLYEVHVEDDCVEAHAHFICRGCGGVSCLEELETPASIPAMLHGNYQVERQQLNLYGSCPRCQEVPR
jgi:Fur family ferric uptake transcriptional regulator